MRRNGGSKRRHSREDRAPMGGEALSLQPASGSAGLQHQNQWRIFHPQFPRSLRGRALLWVLHHLTGGQSMKIKLTSSIPHGGSASKVLKGQEMPRHMQIAYGRFVFRLMHGTPGNAGRPGLWLRDLPLNLCDLVSEYGMIHAGNAYHAECERNRIAMEARYL